MVRAFAGQEVAAVEFLQAVPHPSELRPDRSALGLAGVGRKDEFDCKSVERLLHLRRRKAAGLEFGDAGRERFADRFGRPFTFPLAEHANPLPVLGDVDQIEIDAEGPGDALRLGRVERLDPGGQSPLGIMATRATVAGERADFLDQGQ